MQLVDGKTPAAKLFTGNSSAEMPSDDESEQDVAEAAALTPPSSPDSPRITNDPIRLYLSQMCEIPLLNRDQEISLAKKIEIARKQWRRAVLGNDFALRHTVEILRKVHAGALPFDRTSRSRSPKDLPKSKFPRECHTILKRWMP